MNSPKTTLTHHRRRRGSLSGLKMAQQRHDYDAVHRWVLNELRFRQASLSSIAEQFSRSRQTVSNGIKNGSPVWERVVADILDLEPWEIWPARYDEFCLPKSQQRK